MNYWGFFFFCFPRLGHRFSGTENTPQTKSRPFFNINTCSCAGNAEPPSSPDWLMSFCGFGRKVPGCSFTKSLILTSLPNKQQKGKKTKHVWYWSLGKCSVIFINNLKKAGPRARESSLSGFMWPLFLMHVGTQVSWQDKNLQKHPDYTVTS